jgi:hypothetical protein
MLLLCCAILCGFLDFAHVRVRYLDRDRLLVRALKMHYSTQ